MNNLASLTLELVVCVRRRSRSQFEKVSQIFRAKSVDLLFVIDDALKPLLGKLTLKNLFFDRAGCEEAIGETPLLLPVSPASCSCLFVDGGILKVIENAC